MKPPRRSDESAPRPLSLGPASDDLDRGLDELLDDDRRRTARAQRRARDLRRTIEQDTATLAGILRDFAEHGLGVTIEHPGGRLSGQIISLATDHVVLETRSADLAILAMWSVSTVAPQAGSIVPDPVGRGSRPSSQSLREVLADLVEGAPNALIQVIGRDQPVTGVLRAVGEDVVVVSAWQATRATPSPTVIPLGHVVRVLIQR